MSDGPTGSEFRERLLSCAGVSDIDEFVTTIWQQRAKRLPQLCGDLTTIIDADELAGLACEPHVESRLVQQRGDHFVLRQGPFSARDFSKLPASGWTLLVQDVDKHLAAAHAFLEGFDFVPRWRLDDLMVSYAAPGGGVGPHIDSYDVFLCQALGRRRWQLSSNVDAEALCQECELKVLRHFEAEESFELAPGDCLYLPAAVGHDGVALEECMTFSVGFRAVEASELLSTGSLAAELSEAWLRRAPPLGRNGYLDGLVSSPPNPGELTPETLQRYRAQVRALLALPPEELDELIDVSLARFLTEPKESQYVEPPESDLDAAALLSRLAGGARLRQHPASRWLFVRGVRGAVVRISVDGELHELGAESFGFAAAITNQLALPTATLQKELTHPQHLELVLEWVNRGQLIWD
ncbi:MAG: cupin domain-containing protein [Polyangiaceae bacterium]|nr:cupin domain-containing protein [Polyangiaceae bacterium]